MRGSGRSIAAMTFSAVLGGLCGAALWSAWTTATADIVSLDADESIRTAPETTPDFSAVPIAETEAEVAAIRAPGPPVAVEYAQASSSTEFLAVTECGLSDLLQMSVPDKTFYRACKICRFMTAISLDDVEQALLQNRFQIEVDEPVRSNARKALERMFELTGETRDNLTLPDSVVNE